ncbi:protein SEMI-ROLLED LEAF 2-like [Hibiscus syriacus]|uniref:protein SEMI-ROLLED LEAF 2-like n=1 Tax=Hibiscus syriacus TaxID=106335 RepID=UPI001920A4A9|nr:protein SEMI-ROLLED LEAF 2-like [Hibiscus syriacus]
MSVISGVISRQIFPACGRMCVFCPSLRARSRQPVKRYKRLIAEIFPRNKEDGPNDRKIEKLCEYVSKNPLRIPKITDSLEQRFYKELRNENFLSVKVVVCIYKKLLLSCPDQLTLFATSLQSIIQTLLDQSRQYEMQILGCQTLFDFVINQKDSTFLSNLEGFIPKVCQLAQEIGEGERETNLRSAGLQAISSLIWLMAELSHISVEFDNIVSIVLENYGVPKKNVEDLNGGQTRWVQEVQRTESRVTPSRKVLVEVPSWRRIINDKGELNVAEEDTRNPCFWSRVCLHNMAKLAKEATTTRRVHESVFRYFDKEKLWSAQEDGLALLVLREMQILIDGSGQNAHFLLSVLVKHLDHKNVLKQPDVQLQIVEVITSLARDLKVEASVAILSAVSDVMRHLRKSIHCSLDDATMGTEIINWNKNFKEAVDDCLVQLSHKVGDAGPILDAMAVMLENIPNVTVIARTTIRVVYRTAQIIASLPNPSYLNKAFPEALFHQLLPAMVHPDHEIRIGAHRIFSVVLVPSSVCPQPSSGLMKKASGIPRTLSRTVSVFSSSAALFEKLRKEKSFSRENACLVNKETAANEEQQVNSQNGILIKLKSYSRAYGSRSPLVSSAIDENPPSNSNTAYEANSLRLSSTQISLLLSSIWAQSISPQNTPQNYEAIAHTYSLVLLFSRAKNSSNEALVRSFQLALSLRSISLDEGGTLPPSRRRSLFTLATSMILFSSKAFNILPIVDCIKAALTEITVDPFLRLVDDRKLRAVNTIPDQPTNVYGSKEDETSALKTLSEIRITPEQSRETLASEIMKSLGDLFEPELSVIQVQLLSEFSPDDVCPLGAQLPMDAQHRVYKAGAGENKSIEGASILSIDDDYDDDYDDDAFLEPFESQAKDSSEFSGEISRLDGVNQLLESVLETAYQFGRSPVSTGLDMSYKEIACHCEELMTGKQQKMSPLMNTRPRQESSISFSFQHPDNMAIQVEPVLEQINSTNPFKQLVDVLPMPCATEYHNHPPFFSLPASTPYDNFLKAAGC